MNQEPMETENSATVASTGSEIETPHNNPTETVQVQQQVVQPQQQQQPSQPSTSTENTNPPKPVQTNLQRIKQQKQDVYNWPRNKKLFKLAMFSSCQTEACECNGWKIPAHLVRAQKTDFTQPLEQFTEPCRNCNHLLGIYRPNSSINIK